jgi:signal peptidase I
MHRLPFVLAIAAFAGWFVLLAPTSIGGPATYVLVSGTSMEPTLQTGDFVILQPADRYRVGEIVAFRIPAGTPGAGSFVIHRIVGRSATGGFVTQGDNKDRPDPWQPSSADILGTQSFVWAGGGHVIGWLRDPPVFGSVAAGFTVLCVMLTDWGGSGTPKPVIDWLSRRGRRKSTA